MKQLIIKKGRILNKEVPTPLVDKGFVLIRVCYSSISSGTELAGVSQSRKTMLQRAIEKPEKLSMLLEIMKRKGISGTIKQIRDLNSEGQASGYSVSGIVEESGVEGFNIGDRVAAAGGGYAIHAEYVLVPKNLVVHIPDDVSLKEASVSAIGAIALHGIHRSEIKLGETAAVIGCGLLGLFTVQLLNAAGVRVIASDINEKRLATASSMQVSKIFKGNSPDFVQDILNYTGGTGVDVVFFTAATHESNTLSKSFNICRKKGKVILVGVSGMEINRGDIYSKEIDFLISTSYGPGRYDKSYEDEGIDYPLPYVRWTENRNMSEFLRLIAEKKVNVSSMIEAVYPLEKSADAFGSLQQGKEKPLLVLLEYDNSEEPQQKTSYINLPSIAIKGSRIQVGLVGAGAFAKDVHLPNMTKQNDVFQLRAVLSLNSYQAQIVAEQNQAAYSTTSYKKILEDPDIDLVMITTRHDSHGSLVLDALKAGKNVFVEKPLAVTREELSAIEEFYKSFKGLQKPLLTVGFNRRFSKYAVEIKKHTQKRINPLFIRYRMNAGYLPKDHWVYSCGGRIIGEGCHIIDLIKYLTESEIVSVGAQALNPQTDYLSTGDNKTFNLKYKDGSLATIDYFSCGAPSVPKEYMEIHFDRKTILMTDYQQLQGFNIKIDEIKSSASDKGHYEELESLGRLLKDGSGEWPIPLNDLLETSYAAIDIDSLS